MATRFDVVAKVIAEADRKVAVDAALVAVGAAVAKERADASQALHKRHSDAFERNRRNQANAWRDDDAGDAAAEKRAGQDADPFEAAKTGAGAAAKANQKSASSNSRGRWVVLPGGGSRWVPDLENELPEVPESAKNPYHRSA